MKALILAFVLCLPLAACGDDPPAEENVDVEGCEHLQEGPAVPVTATAEAGEATPEVAGDHMRYDVTLLATADGHRGFIAFAADEATDFVFFLGADVPFAVIDSAGAPVTIESSETSSPVCTDIKGKHTVELGVGTYFLELGPTPETQVGVVVEEASGHADE